MKPIKGSAKTNSLPWSLPLATVSGTVGVMCVSLIKRSLSVAGGFQNSVSWFLTTREVCRQLSRRSVKEMIDETRINGAGWYLAQMQNRPAEKACEPLSLTDSRHSRAGFRFANHWHSCANSLTWRNWAAHSLRFEATNQASF